MPIYSDKALSRRLERVEACASADFVETRSRLHPGCGAAWTEVAGVYAMFDGVGSPITQTFGLGLFDEISEAELDTIEAFFTDRGAAVCHEVSPMACSSLMPLLNKRMYRPIELTSVMYRSLDDLQTSPRDHSITTRIISSDEVDTWARTSANGWITEAPELADFMYSFGQISAQCQGSFPFLAEIDGQAIATGMLFIHEDTAILAGASTVPEGRNKGAQNALLDARLRFARERGCTLAAMGALPGSQSQRNAQKNGFNIAYTRTKWQLVGR
jgi:GNAT superfamily N-acetyltransferase